MHGDTVHHCLRHTRAAIVVGLAVWVLGAWWAVRMFGGLPGLLALGWGVSFLIWASVFHGRNVRALLASRHPSTHRSDSNRSDPAA